VCAALRRATGVNRVRIRVRTGKNYAGRRDRRAGSPANQRTEMTSIGQSMAPPLELWQDITSYLPNRDIKSMRLASQHLQCSGTASPASVFVGQHVPEKRALVKISLALGGDTHWKEGSLE
jgi:hypothetical protein